MSANPLAVARHLYLNGVEVTDLVVPDDVTEIKPIAFVNCDGLNSVTIGGNVASIGEYAFYECDNLVNLQIGEGVRSICDNAFNGCNNLANLQIGEGVQSIGLDAFAYCYNLKKIDITNLSAWCKIDFKCVYYVYDGYSVPQGNPLAFAGHLYLNGVEITDLVIPDDITELKPMAFIGSKGFNTVTIGRNVASIGKHAFAYCTTPSFKAYAPVPPVCDGYETFYKISENSVLHVPVGTRELYANAAGWSVFKNIIDDIVMTGVDEVTEDDVDDGIVEVYNLQGSRLEITRRGQLTELPAGIYIVNGKKIYVK